MLPGGKATPEDGAGKLPVADLLRDLVQSPGRTEGILLAGRRTLTEGKGVRCQRPAPGPVSKNFLAKGNQQNMVRCLDLKSGEHDFIFG